MVANPPEPSWRSNLNGFLFGEFLLLSKVEIYKIEIYFKPQIPFWWFTINESMFASSTVVSGTVKFSIEIWTQLFLSIFPSDTIPLKTTQLFGVAHSLKSNSHANILSLVTRWLSPDKWCSKTAETQLSAHRLAYPTLFPSQISKKNEKGIFLWSKGQLFNRSQLYCMLSLTEIG